jgi:hypothetical protein
MGYTTNFDGSLKLSKNLTEEQFKYIELFNETRRMKRDVNKLMELYDGKHGYPGRTGTPEEIYGNDGEYFVGGTGHAGQDRDDIIIDYNTSPGQLEYDGTMDFNERWTQNELRKVEGKCQPGLWCQWGVADRDGVQTFEWDGGEKFYNYTEWLSYLITHFFEPWGIKLTGEIEWVGEDIEDRGKIVVENNDIAVYRAESVYVYKESILASGKKLSSK